MAGLHPVVVITGATGAIGSATASLLARRGARLLLLGRPSDRLDTMVERLDRDNRVSSVERLSGAGRVVTVTAPSSTRVDLDQLVSKDHFSPLRTFGATKAANLLFTFELARRAKRWDVRACAYHPGLVRSELMREAPRPIRLLTRIVSGSPNRAAEDLAELAISPAFQSTTGWLFKGTRRIDPPRSTLDLEAQHSLWKRTADLVELDESGF